MVREPCLPQPFQWSILIHGALAVFFAGVFWWQHRTEVLDSVSIVELRERAAAPQSAFPQKPKTPPPVKPSVPVPSTNAPAAESKSETPSVPTTGATSDSAIEGVRSSYEVASLPVLIRESRVPYPPEARAKGVSGDVQAELIVSSTGQVIQIKILQSPDPILAQAAEAALKTFEFKPAVMDGKPVSVRIRYRYRFVLEN